MDNLTHSLTGLMLSRAGFNRRLPRATLLLVTAANLPDIDVVTGLFGSLAYLEHHRGPTHSLLLLPVMAAFPVVLWRWFSGREASWLWAYVASCVGVLSHLLLDWTNTYGIRLLSPLAPTWFRLDSTYIVDAWIWMAFMLALAGPALSRLVSGEIGARPSSGRGAAWAALLFVLAYDAGRWVLHGRATDIVRGRVIENETPLRAYALPSGVNPLLWTGVAETSRLFATNEIRLWQEGRQDEAEVVYKPEPGAALTAALESETMRRFLRFCPGPLVRVVPDAAGGHRVEAIDLRFGTISNPGFATTVRVNERQQVVEEKFSF